MSIEKEIRAEMIRRDITTIDLANQIKMPRQTLSRKLNGHVEFTITEIGDIAKVFGLEDWELLKRKSIN